MWKCVPSAITCLLTKKNNKKNNQWKIQYGQKYFKTTNILEDFHLRVCQMRKNFIYLLLTRSGPYPRMPLFTAGREAGRATFGVDAF